MKMNDQFQAPAVMSFLVIRIVIKPFAIKHPYKRMRRTYKSSQCLSYSSSCITDLGRPQSLPQLSSTVLHPANCCTSPVPHADFLNCLKPSKLRFSYSSNAFWYKKSDPSALIQFLLSTEVTNPPQSFYFYHFF
jgi:hypothetical protein